MGSTALRSCSPLLALQHLGKSGRATYYYCLLSTSKVSMMVASQYKWVSSCSSSCPGTQSRSVEEKQEEPFVSSGCGSSSGGKLSTVTMRQAVNQREL